MRAFSCRDLEAHGKFSKNDKLSFISDDMLILFEYLYCDWYT